MIETLLVAAVAAAMAVWTLKPLFGSAAAPEATADPELDDLMEAKGSVYRTIIDLEMDYKLGKLERSEYELMRNESKAEALSLIRRIDAGAPAQPDELTLEQEIEQARARLRKQ